jgi:hypothetical protein
MASSISIIPNNIPVLDGNNNFTTAWYIFMQNLWLRAGGAVSQSNNDLIIGQLDDAGIEEMKADLYAMRDQISIYAATVQSLLDDLNNAPSVQQGYDYNPANINETGGTIDGITIGATTPSTGKFTDITNGNAAALIKTSVALNNGAAAAAATFLNSPVAGNPTKWAPVNDNGTIRYVPLF